MEPGTRILSWHDTRSKAPILAKWNPGVKWWSPRVLNFPSWSTGPLHLFRPSRSPGTLNLFGTLIILIGDRLYPGLYPHGNPLSEHTSSPAPSSLTNPKPENIDEPLITKTNPHKIPGSYISNRFHLIWVIRQTRSQAQGLSFPYPCKSRGGWKTWWYERETRSVIGVDRPQCYIRGCLVIFSVNKVRNFARVILQDDVGYRGEGRSPHQASRHKQKSHLTIILIWLSFATFFWVATECFYDKLKTQFSLHG